MLAPCVPADTQEIPAALQPRAWRDTRWVGSLAGRLTTPDLLAGGFLGSDHEHAVTRVYAAACADLAQATLGGAPAHSRAWDRWFAGFRSAVRELSPARGNQHVVQRALFHGARLEGGDAPWARQLRRGFSALLAASLLEPVPALIGEDLATFRSADDAWLTHHQPGLAQEVQPLEPVPSESDRPLPGTSSTPVEAPRWPTASLRPNPLNPRGRLDPASIDELAASIAAHAAHGGILQPLLVTPDGTVVAGHRRLAAARRVGLTDVPVMVRSLSPIEQLELQLVENLQRADLTPIEEGRAYRHLLDAGATLASIARVVGLPASRVRERLALLDLDHRVQESVHRGELPMRIALALAPLRDATRQRRLAGFAVRRRLTVLQVRRLVESALALPPISVPAPLPRNDQPDPGGLSFTRLEAIEALRAQPNRQITFGQLAALAASECCACGLGSAPTICAECPNLHLLRALLRQEPRRA